MSVPMLNQIKSGFDRSPIVSITGLRQSGKTTLAKDFASQYQGSCTHFGLEIEEINIFDSK